MLRALYEEGTSAIVEIDWQFPQTREFVSVFGTFACPSYMDAAEFERRVCIYFRRPITIYLDGRRVASPTVRVGELTVDVTGRFLQFRHAGAGDEVFTGDIIDGESTTAITWELPTCREFRGSWGTIRVPEHMMVDDFRRRLRSFWGGLSLNIIVFDEHRGYLEIEPGSGMRVFRLPPQRIMLEAVDPDHRRLHVEAVDDGTITRIRVRSEPVVIGNPNTDNYVHLPHQSSRFRNRTKPILGRRQ